MTAAFRSPFADDLAEFLAFKRAHGRVYDIPESRLRDFDRFVAKQGRRSRGQPLLRLIAAWLDRPPPTLRKDTAVHPDLSVMRQFCLFLRRRNLDTEVPDRSLSPPTVPSRFVPHIFSHEEIRRLLRTVHTIRPPFRARMFRALLLVLYCTGLRIGEAVRLRICDVDLRARTLCILNSKGKSRIVPFDSSLAREIRRYLKARDAITPRLHQGPLFIQCNGRRYRRRNTVSYAIVRLLRSAGLKPFRGRVGPRAFDFRATFAVHRLTCWYRTGVDLHARLPWLSTYMGHENLLGTEVYLPATTALLQHASRRFAARFHHRGFET
jgi:site-specific recombinase XerD